MASQHRLHLTGHDGQTTGADRVVESAQHAQTARIIQHPKIIGAKPPRLTERVRVGGIAVTGSQGCPADHHPALAAGRGVIDAHGDPVERSAVVHAAARGLTGAVGSHHGDTGRGGGLEDRPRRRATAEQDRVHGGQCRHGRRVGQGLGQLVGHQRGVPAPGAQFLDGRRQIGRVESAIEVDLGGDGAGLQAADQYLDARDVVRRQGQQPASGSAEPVMGGRCAGDQRGRGEHGPLGGAGGSRRRDHQGDLVVDLLTDPQSRCQTLTFTTIARGDRHHGCVAAVQNALKRCHQRQRAGARRDGEGSQGDSDSLILGRTACGLRSQLVR